MTADKAFSSSKYSLVWQWLLLWQRSLNRKITLTLTLDIKYYNLILILNCF